MDPHNYAEHLSMYCEKLERYVKTSQVEFQPLNLLCKIDPLTSVLSNECQILVVLTVVKDLCFLYFLLHDDDIITSIGARVVHYIDQNMDYFIIPVLRK